jgi:hypothetical protein
MNKTLKAAVLTLTILLGYLVGIPSAYADSIVWSITDLVWDDGGTASGTFSTDSLTGNLLGSYDITTTDGSSLSGFHYTTSNSFAEGMNGIVGFALNDYSRYVIITYGTHGNPPFDATGTFLVDGGSETLSDNTWRAPVSGEVVSASPVPEPETYAMLLAGLGLLGFAARRRKLKAA